MRKRFIAIAGLGSLTAVMSQLPLKWIGPYLMPESAGSNVKFSGTLWNGQVRGLDFIDRVHLNLSPKAFLTGGLPLKFKTHSSAMAMSGKASRRQLKDVVFTGKLAMLPTRDGRLKELAGQVDIIVSDLQIKDQQCASALGQLSTDFLAMNQTRWQWSGPELAGPISCEAGDLIVNLSGMENRQTIRADLRLSKNGSYAANITVQTDQPEAGVVLPLYGFEKKDRDYQLTEQGQWR